MSKKTIFKRIALAAVSALAAGTLSVVAVPSANAAAAGEIDNLTGSVGLVASSLSGRTTTKTATLLKTGSLTVGVNAASGYYVVSSGGLITTSTGTSDVIDNDQTGFTSGNADNTFTVTATGAVGSTFTVTGYSSTAMTTIVHVLTVTIADSDKSGVASAIESTVRWDSNNSGSAPTAAEDVTNSETTYSNTLELYINVADAYAVDIDNGASTGYLQITASSGAYLGTPAASSAAAGSAKVSTQVFTGDPSAVWVLLREATVGAGWSGTVTVSYNGVLLATKTGKITGAPSKIEVQPYKIGRTGDTSVAAFLYTVKDAAGNGLDFTSSDLVLDTSSNSAVVSAISSTSVTNASSTSVYGAYVGSGKIVCTGSAGVAGGGTSSLVLKYTLSNGSVIKSNPFTATCGGDAYNFTASLDKASYVQGEVATMTITFRDAKGNLANSTTAVGTGSGTTNDATISAPMMAMVGTMGAGADMKPNVKGQLTYKFTVGTSSGLTAGKYNAVVTFPTLAYADAVSVAYEVGTGAAAQVSTNEVLAAIVKLIATINKQIRALQKQLRR